MGRCEGPGRSREEGLGCCSSDAYTDQGASSQMPILSKGAAHAGIRLPHRVSGNVACCSTHKGKLLQLAQCLSGSQRAFGT